MHNPSATLRSAWARLNSVPGGTWLFSQVVGWVVPYSRTVGAHVRELRPGYCRATLRDRRKVRNHFQSIHAVALINLGELASGLATTLALPPHVRGIPIRITAQYLKKARGRLTAEAQVFLPAVGESPLDYQVESTISDPSGEPVCRVAVTWRLERR